MNYKLSFLLLIIVCSTGLLPAQTFGGHPPSVEWRQINTENVRVIFPDKLEGAARRTAGLIDYIQANSLRSVGDRSLKFDLVLQSLTVRPNGYVGLAPFRSEFYATPFQNLNVLGVMDWIDGLAIHEYRHVLQYANARRGITGLLYYLQGEFGWAFASGLSVPDWYFEGDAVVAETALSEGGRGRMPSFTAEQRALLLNGYDYPYRKARNGSFKDLVPNEYPLGYALVTYARDRFGSDVWRDVLREGAAYRSLLYPFSRALKRHTGLTTRELYDTTYAYLDSAWTAQQARLNLTPTTPLSEEPPPTVTYYQYANYLADGSVIALKSSFRQTPQLVRFHNDQEEVLTRVGRQQEPYLSATNGRVVWTEFQQDPRWINRNYSVVVTYDPTNNQKRQITHRSRYFSPAYNHRGDALVAVRIDEAQQVNLVVLDPMDGAERRLIPNPEGYYISYPKWTADDDGIVFIAKKDSRIAFVRYDPATDQYTRLTDWTTEIMDVPTIAGDHLYYSGSQSGIDNIHALDLNSGESTQITSVPIGAYMPAVSPDGRQLVMSEQTPTGYALTQLEIGNGKVEVGSGQPSPTGNPVSPLRGDGRGAWEDGSGKWEIGSGKSELFNEEGGNILDKIPEGSDYSVRPYRGFLRGFKVHSWSLNVDSPDPEVGVFFGDILGNVTGSLGAYYLWNERTPGYRFSLSYGGWYPVFTLLANQQSRTVNLRDDNGNLRRVDFEQAIMSGGLSVPLTWLKGDYSLGIRPSAAYQYNLLYNFRGDFTEPVPNDEFTSVTASISLSHLRRQARRQVQPREGRQLVIAYRQALSGREGGQWRAEGSLYLPGLALTHGLRLDGGYQWEPLSNNFQFSDAFSYPRGYNAPVNDRTYKLGVNYQLPLLYPDWGFAGILYFLRVRANAFYDAGAFYLSDTDAWSPLHSTGAELSFDMRGFNAQDFSLGVRYAHLLHTDPREPERTGRWQLFTALDF